MKARIAVEDRPPARDEFVRTTILPLAIVAIVGIFLVTICLDLRGSKRISGGALTPEAARAYVFSSREST
jgi:hypothetical protein